MSSLALLPEHNRNVDSAGGHVEGLRGRIDDLFQT